MGAGEDRPAPAPPPGWTVAAACAVALAASPLAAWTSRAAGQGWEPLAAFLAGAAVVNALYVLVFLAWTLAPRLRAHLPGLRVGWDDVIRTLVLTLGAFTAAVAVLAIAAAVDVTPSGAGVPVIRYSTRAAVAVAVLRFAVGPVAEELFFRGVLLSGLRTRIGGWAVGAQALLFGIAHLRSLTPPDVGTAVSAATVGAVLGWGIHRWNRLPPAVGAHVLVNFL